MKKLMNKNTIIDKSNIKINYKNLEVEFTHRNKTYNLIVDYVYYPTQEDLYGVITDDFYQQVYDYIADNLLTDEMIMEHGTWHMDWEHGWPVDPIDDAVDDYLCYEDMMPVYKAFKTEFDKRLKDYAIDEASIYWKNKYLGKFK